MKKGFWGFLIVVISIIIISIIFVYFYGVPDSGMDKRLKFYNISNKRINFVLARDTILYNKDIFDYSRPFEIKKNGDTIKYNRLDALPYSKTSLETYNDWEKELKIQKHQILYYYLIDLDSLQDIYNKNRLDSTLIKKVLLKRLDITLEFMKKNKWIIIYRQK